MKKLYLSFVTVAALTLAAPVHAAGCYADYKAKQDNPLRLHYGVAQISGNCTRAAAAAQLSAKLARDGWTLLNVMSVFGDEGLAQRRDSAGQFFLRY